jgi:hypothetical protein
MKREIEARRGAAQGPASKQSPRPISARGKFCMKKRIEMRPLTKREAREKQKLEQEQQALLKQWGVTEQDLRRWRRHALAARRLRRNGSVRVKRYAREAAFEDVGDYELCLDLAGKHARESVKKTGGAIADVRDRYEAIVLGFRCAHGAQSSEAPLALGSALNALAQAFQRDRKGLLRFLDAVFKRWREIDQPDSLFRQRLLTYQLTGTPREVAAAVVKLGAAKCSTEQHYHSLGERIRQYRSRDPKAALKRRKL